MIGKNVCQEANQPKTTSARSTPRTTATGFGQRPGLVEVLDLVALGEDLAVDRHEARLAAVHVEDALRSRGHRLPRLDERARATRTARAGSRASPCGRRGRAGARPRAARRRPGRSARRAASRARSGARPRGRATRAASRRRAWRSRACVRFVIPGGSSRSIARRCRRFGCARPHAPWRRGSAPRSASARRRGTARAARGRRPSTSCRCRAGSRPAGTCACRGRAPARAGRGRARRRGRRAPWRAAPAPPRRRGRAVTSARSRVA